MTREAGTSCTKACDGAELLVSSNVSPLVSCGARSLQFIMLHGNDSMRNAQEKVHSTLTSFLGSMVLLVAIHVILLVLTIIMCIG